MMDPADFRPDNELYAVNKVLPVEFREAKASHNSFTVYCAMMFTVLATIISSGIADRLLLIAGIGEFQAAIYFLVISSYALLALAAIISSFSLRLFFKSMLLWFPVLFFFSLSLLWTVNVPGTVSKFMSFLVLVSSVSLFCSSKAYTRLLTTLYLIGILTGFGSLVGMMLFPELTYFFAHRMFVGIFAHKGPLADAAVIGALVAAYYFSTDRTIFSLLVFSACVWAIYMSATWSAIFGFILAISVFIRPRHGRFFLLSSHAFAMSLPVILLTFDTTWLVDALGRDATFSGRAHLWEFVLRSLDGSWVVGSGFYNVGSSVEWNASLDVIFNRDVNEVANHTHNFWMESLYMGGSILVCLMIIYTILIPIVFYDYNSQHHKMLMALVVYLAFSAALKLPFYSNSLPSVIYLMAITVFATHQRHVVVPTVDIDSALR